MKTKKRLLNILLSLALVLGLVPGMTMTALADETTWTNNSLPSTSGNYKLGNNINVGSPSSESIVVLGSNQNISIDLAGHTITMAADSSNNHTFYQIKSGATLTITDSVGGGKITRSGTYSDDSVIWVDGGTLNWEGGTVSDVYTKCGVIDVGNGQFNMTGGSFTGNHLSNNGQGAVRLLSGNSFLRISGTPVITGNTGGNVYVSNGSKIEIIGMLSSGANISVNMQTPGVFTSGYGSHYNTDSSVSDPWNFFQSDDSENKWVLWNDDFTEAKLGSKTEYPERKSAVRPYTIDYENETATPQSRYELSTNGTTTADSPVNLSPIFNESENPVIFVRKKAEGSQEAGQWEQVPLSSRPDAPTGINPTNATNGTSADGTITGVNTTMEYSVDGTNWTAVSDTTITGLNPGTYYVRVKATETAPHGIPTEVKVGSREIILQDNQKPTPKTDLIFNGSAQELLNKPSAPLPEGAVEIQYAIGTDATTAPEDGWGTSIPKATDVGTYYVWYKVVGDENHTDTEPVPLEVTIVDKGETEIKTEVKKDDKSPEVKASNLTDEIAESTLTSKEKADIEDAISEGKDVDIDVYLEIKDISDTISASDKEKVKAAATDVDNIEYFDISLFKEIYINQQTLGATSIHNLATPLKLTIGIPKSFPAVADGYTRTYVVLRLHDGSVTVLPTTLNADGTLSFETDKFSTYALAYTDVKKEETKEPTADTPTTTVDTPKAEAKNTDNKISTGDKINIGVIVMLMIDSAMAALYLTLRRKMIK